MPNSSKGMTDRAMVGMPSIDEFPWKLGLINYCNLSNPPELSTYNNCPYRQIEVVWKTWRKFQSDSFRAHISHPHKRRFKGIPM
eukprot:13742398-Ditylum_brightwellii.AAC.1